MSGRFTLLLITALRAANTLFDESSLGSLGRLLTTEYEGFSSMP